MNPPKESSLEPQEESSSQSAVADAIHNWLIENDLVEHTSLLEPWDGLPNSGEFQRLESLDWHESFERLPEGSPSDAWEAASERITPSDLWHTAQA